LIVGTSETPSEATGYVSYRALQR